MARGGDTSSRVDESTFTGDRSRLNFTQANREAEE
jgi:hypothetical protein